MQTERGNTKYSQSRFFAQDVLEPGVFAKWLTAAKTQIESGAQTNEQIITKIEVQSRLTDEQKEQIRAIGASDLEINESDDGFLDE